MIINKSSHIELHKHFLKGNIDFIRSVLNPGVQFASVIKGNAYGHGISELVPLLESLGVNYFAVYSIEEAQQFYTVASPNSQLIIMGYIPEDSLRWVIERGYEFYIFEFSRLQQAVLLAREFSAVAKIHIELETGMNRTGIEPQELNHLFALLHENQNFILIKGTCSHLAGAENISNHQRILGQIKLFQELLEEFEKNNVDPGLRHMASSAGILRYPEAQFDMVRVGILQYGFWPSQETRIEFLYREDVDYEDPLMGIMSWHTRIMSVKQIPKGQYVGYGSTYVANKDMKIAVIPVGYAYGYSRLLSNQGRVLIKGRLLQVAGMVNMNMMAVDVSALDNVKMGDEVILIGRQGENEITVSSFSELSTQLNYELLTRLPNTIPRIVKQ